ncbi:MAG: hypothetical protein OXH23_17105, partial [bacterium]|nr:hypothetical protein [bacterium]
MADAEVLTTAGGVAFVRTPEERFAGLDDYPYEPRYVDLDGLQMGYVVVEPDESDEETTTVLLLHGEPTWGYLFR